MATINLTRPDTNVPTDRFAIDVACATLHGRYTSDRGASLVAVFPNVAAATTFALAVRGAGWAIGDIVTFGNDFAVAAMAPI